MSLLLGPAYKSFARETGLDEPFRRFIIGKRDEHLDTTGGIHGSGKSWPNAVLRGLFVQRELFTPTGDVPVFLDFGSSIGAQVIYAAREGWSGYGVDFCGDCHTVAKDNIKKSEEAGYIPPEKARVAEGNFFPEDFDIGGRTLDIVMGWLDVALPRPHNSLKCEFSTSV